MAHYEICIRGVGGALITDAFSELDVESRGDHTVLSGDVLDQEALHALLGRVRDLGLDLAWTREVPQGHHDAP